jgi:predicted DNA-binding protein (MmcQ/YjbR family)
VTVTSTSTASARLRKMCLGYPQTTETSAWGHPNFKAGKKTFAAIEQIGGRPSFAFRLPPADVERLLTRKTFFATPYGRGQWVSVWVDGPLDWKAVTDLVDRSYRTVAQKRMLAALDVRA